MRPSLLRALRVSALAVALGGSAGLLHAEKADGSKPMNIEADALRYDDLKQTSVFTGHVVLTKGTIVIRGARLEVRQDPQGYQYATVTAEPGKLAFYRQKREGVDEFIEGEGRTIEFDGRADRVRFIRDAELRRFRGATLSDEVSGALVVYDNTTDVFTVDGTPADLAGRAGGKPAGRAGGRVRATLMPQPQEATPSSGATRSTPGAPLRPSNRLGDGAGR